MPERDLTEAEAQAILEGLTNTPSDAVTPLLCFQALHENTGVSEITPRERSGGGGDDRGSRTYTRLMYRFKELIVCQAGSLCGDKTCQGSTQPFPWKTAEVPMSYGDAGAGPGSSSRSGILGASVDKIFGRSTKVVETHGKRVHWKMTPGHAMRRHNNETNEWNDYLGEAFVVLSVDGQTGPEGVAATIQAAVVDIDELLAGFADGVDQKAFNTKALQSKQVQDSPVFQQLVTSSEAVLQGLIAKGRLTKDEEGVYRKTEQPF